MTKNKKILLLCGIPGSGKTTWKLKFLHENEGWVSVCRDDFKYGLRNVGWLDAKGESFVTELVEQTIIRAIKNKYNVIVDQTNVNLERLNILVSFCEKLADVEFKLFPISFESALERDSNRERKVGKEVMEKMYKNYLNLFNSNFDFSERKKKPYIAENIEYNTNPFSSLSVKTVLFDIDGTISHAQGKRDPYDWSKVDLDVVDEKMRETILAYHYLEFIIIIVTGRDSSAREKTEKWLFNNKIPFDHLFMKAENDYRKSPITKKEIYENNIKNKFNVLCVYEDRYKDTEMWRELGLKCYQVDNGMF